MREEIKDIGRLTHMLTAIDNVAEFTDGVTLNEFIKNKILFFAVVKKH